MKHKQKAAWFLSGVLAAILASLMISPALALFAKTIQVHSGVNIYVDDKQFQPQGYDGTPLESFIHNGNTYLPVRAISDVLRVPIQWDGDTQSVYIGAHKGTTPAAWLHEMDYFSGDSYIDTIPSDQDNTGGTQQNCIIDSFERTYLLNMQYSTLSGTIYQRYKERSHKGILKLNIYGDGKLLYTNKFTGSGFKPIDFNIDLTNVSELKISFYTNEPMYFPNVFALSDVALWT